MNPTATVTRDAEGDLNREVWVFELWGDASVYLRSYTKDSRQTKRHKWRPEEGYFRLQTDRNSPVRKLPHPEVPKDVLEEGLAELRGRITFKVWGK